MIERILPIGLTALTRTLRFEFRGELQSKRAIVTFWHSKMIAGWHIARQNNHQNIALVSKSKDGEYLTRVLRSWKYDVIRGSSGKDGMKSLQEAMLRMKMSSGATLAITPDGPQGPKEIFKRGMFLAAKELQLPLYFLEITYEHSKVFHKSWDKFEVPFPFSKVIVTGHLLDTHNFPDTKDEQNEFLAEASKRFSSIPADDY